MEATVLFPKILLYGEPETMKLMVLELAQNFKSSELTAVGSSTEIDTVLYDTKSKNIQLNPEKDYNVSATFTQAPLFGRQLMPTFSAPPDSICFQNYDTIVLLLEEKLEQESAQTWSSRIRKWNEDAHIYFLIPKTTSIVSYSLPLGCTIDFNASHDVHTKWAKIIHVAAEVAFRKHLAVEEEKKKDQKTCTIL
jgi:hypothetical protein